MNEYYPFGLVNQQTSSTQFGSKEQRYKYNGKELMKDFGLESEDYGARLYSPQIGRWQRIDPKADKYLSISPYSYVANNPLKYIDPDGETLRVAGHIAMAENDIKSILPNEDFQSRVSVENSIIVFNVTEEEVQNAADPGVSALYSLVNRSETSELNVDNQHSILDKSGNTKQEAVNTVDESSKTSHHLDKMGKEKGNKGADNSVDRSRTINPKYDGKISGNRAATVLHEFLEMDMQLNGIPYVDNKTPETGAHNKAIDVQRTLPKNDSRRGNGGRKFDENGNAIPE
jgi:RHS repeat-associated protein